MHKKRVPIFITEILPGVTAGRKEGNLNLEVVEYKNIRVLTTQQIAEAYGTDVQVITNNYNRNKSRYITGKHYVCLTGDELREFRAKNQNDVLPNANKFYLWTEKGAFLHAKSLNTDKAWEVYDRLVDSYFQKPQKPLSELEMMRIQLGMIDGHEERIERLENTMTIDYGQQQNLKNAVSKRVIDVLGGKKAPAYKSLSKKVFAECNHDIQDYFCVNSRNNIPAVRYEEAVEYVDSWNPSNNTILEIRNFNSGMCEAYGV